MLLYSLAYWQSDNRRKGFVWPNLKAQYCPNVQRAQSYPNGKQFYYLKYFKSQSQLVSCKVHNYQRITECMNHLHLRVLTISS